MQRRSASGLKLEVPPINPYNYCMMNEKDKGLRGLGGTKTVVSYTDTVLSAYECVSELADDNKCDFNVNLSLFLEGLEEDILELRDGRELRHIPVRPKEQQDVE